MQDDSYPGAYSETCRCREVENRLMDRIEKLECILEATINKTLGPSHKKRIYQDALAILTQMQKEQKAKEDQKAAQRREEFLRMSEQAIKDKLKEMEHK